MLLLSIAGCNHPASSQKNKTAVTVSVENNQPDNPSAALTAVKQPEINSEKIEWDDMTINGTLPLLTTTPELFIYLEKPDSLITQDLNEDCTSFYDDKPFKNAYFNDSNFEIYGDTAVISYIL